MKKLLLLGTALLTFYSTTAEAGSYTISRSSTLAPYTYNDNLGRYYISNKDPMVKNKIWQMQHPEEYSYLNLFFGEGYDKLDIIQWGAYDNPAEIGLTPIRYENQVDGTLSINNKAQITVKDALAANAISLSGSSKLKVNSTGLLSFDTLSATENSEVTIDSRNNPPFISPGAELKVNLNSSTLNIKKNVLQTSQLIAENNSKVNITNLASVAFYGTGDDGLVLNGSEMNVNDSYVLGGGITSQISNARLNLSNWANVMLVGSDNASSINLSEINVSKNSNLILNSEVSDSTVTLNDTSVWATGVMAMQVGEFMGYKKKVTLVGELGGLSPKNITISSSVLNLNGKSSLVAGLLKQDMDKDVYIPISASEIAQMKQRAYWQKAYMINYDTYTPVPYSDEAIDTALAAVESWKNLPGNISISGSTINMSGTAKIENALMDEDTSNIGIDNSNLVVKGKNTISAGGQISLTDTTLDIAKGANLSVWSTLNTNGDNELTVDNLRLKLSGTLDGSLKGTVSTLILGANGKITDLQHSNIDGLESFGVSGITASAGILNALATYQAMGGNGVETFEITDKSKFVYDTKAPNIAFENMNVEDSTLDIKKAMNLDGGLLSANTNSTISIGGAGELLASSVTLEDSNLKITGTGIGNITLTTLGGLFVDNSDNAKAVVDVKNAMISGAVEIADTNKTTLNNVAFQDNLTLTTDSVVTDKKGNPLKTATLTNVLGGQNLIVNNIKATSNTCTYFAGGVTVSGIGQFEIKGEHAGDVTLSDGAMANLAANKILIGGITLNDNSSFVLNGKITGNISGDATLSLNNAKSQVGGNVEGVKLVLNKLKGNLKNWFSGSVENLTSTTFEGATVTADHDSFNDFGDLILNKSKLTLTQDVSANSLTMDGSSLYLGTNTMTVSGIADLTRNKNSLFLNVDSATKYGQLSADTIKLGMDAKGKGTTALNVTLKKDIPGLAGKTFEFLNYTTGKEGELGAVKIANNRYKFTETAVGQFSVSASTNGKGVIERYVAPKMAMYAAPARNLVRTAAATVDNPNAQDNLSVGLDALSQQVGGEESYINALRAINPDDSGMVLTNTLNTMDGVSSAISTRLSSGGLSAMEGMSSGDDMDGGAVWTKMLYNHAKLSESNEYAGFKANNQGLAMGADKHFSKAVKAGIGYAYTDGTIKSDLRHNEVDTHTAFVYGEYKPTAWFINGSMSYGWSDYDNKAYSVLGTTQSDFSVEAFSSNIRSGYDISVGENAIVTPSIGMRYTNLNQHSYRDSDGKKISGSHSDIVTALAGVKAETTMQMNDSVILKPEGYLGISYDIANDADSSVVTLSNGSVYSVEGRALSRSGIEAALGLTAQIGDNWELSAGYEAKFRDDFQDHTGMLSLRYNF